MVLASVRSPRLQGARIPQPQTFYWSLTRTMAGLLGRMNGYVSTRHNMVLKVNYSNHEEVR